MTKPSWTKWHYLRTNTYHSDTVRIRSRRVSEVEGHQEGSGGPCVQASSVLSLPGGVTGSAPSLQQKCSHGVQCLCPGSGSGFLLESCRRPPTRQYFGFPKEAGFNTLDSQNNYISVGITSKARFSDASQGPAWHAGLSKDNSVRTVHSFLQSIIPQ